MENKIQPIQPIQPIPESMILLAMLKDSATLIKETSLKIKKYEGEIKVLMDKLPAEQKTWVETEWRGWSEKNLK